MTSLDGGAIKLRELNGVKVYEVSAARGVVDRTIELVKSCKIV